MAVAFMARCGIGDFYFFLTPFQMNTSASNSSLDHNPPFQRQLVFLHFQRLQVYPPFQILPAYPSFWKVLFLSWDGLLADDPLELVQGIGLEQK